MKNRKGFVMTETLVVTMFLVSIFSFIYVSIVPLLGKYEDMVDREQDIDIVYKLYHLRKLLFSDSISLSNSNFVNLTSGGSNSVTNFCNKISSANRSYCTTLLEYLELTNFTLVYTKEIFPNLASIESTSKDMHEYIEKYQDIPDSVVILVDNETHKMAHLIYDPS